MYFQNQFLFYFSYNINKFCQSMYQGLTHISYIHLRGTMHVTLAKECIEKTVLFVSNDHLYLLRVSSTTIGYLDLQNQYAKRFKMQEI